MSSKNNFYYTLQAFHKEVTGSAIICTIHFPNNIERNILVDFGIYQEAIYEDRNEEIQFNINKIDAVLVTHSHVDHVGRLPLLVKKGYSGPIYCTSLTRRISYELLKSSAKNFEIEYQKEKRISKNPTPPLYNEEDVENMLSLMRIFDYNVENEILDGINITFLDNGHLLSASSIYLKAYYRKEPTLSVLFSGDYKETNLFKKVQKIPEKILNSRLSIVTESTLCEEYSKPEKVFKNKVISCLENKKGLLILSLAQERLETILFNLKEIQDLGYDLDICIDAPLGVLLKDIYLKHSAINFMPKGIITITNKEERELVFINPKKRIYIVSSGMADYGNAPFYLQNLLPRTDFEILFTSYLSSGSLGRKIMEAPKNGKISIIPFNKSVEKNATVSQTREFSSHANKDELLKFLSQFPNLNHIFVNHGSTAAQEEMKNSLNALNLSSIILGTDNFHKVTNKGDYYSYPIFKENVKVKKIDDRPSKYSSLENRTIPNFLRKNCALYQFH